MGTGGEAGWREVLDGVKGGVESLSKVTMVTMALQLYFSITMDKVL